VLSAVQWPGRQVRRGSPEAQVLRNESLVFAVCSQSSTYLIYRRSDRAPMEDPLQYRCSAFIGVPSFPVVGWSHGGSLYLYLQVLRPLQNPPGARVSARFAKLARIKVFGTARERADPHFTRVTSTPPWQSPGGCGDGAEFIAFQRRGSIDWQIRYQEEDPNTGPLFTKV